MSVSGPPRKWRKAKASQPSENCVEIGLGVDDTGVRDSKDRDGGEFYVDNVSWRGLLAHLKRS